MSLLTRFVNVFRARALDQELDDELRFHLDRRVADYIQQGMGEEEAETAALARFGTLAVIKDQMRGIDMLNRSFIAGLAVGVLAVSIPVGVLWRGHAHASLAAPPLILRTSNPVVGWDRPLKIAKIRCGRDVIVAVSHSAEITPPKGCALISPTQ
jgi:hypothetical protein